MLIGSEKQAEEAIEKDEHKHFLKPEQEKRNFFKRKGTVSISFEEENV